jgi:hypothetical protein
MPWPSTRLNAERGRALISENTFINRNIFTKESYSQQRVSK